MQEVKVTELRNNLPAYLNRVQGGEELILTSRGRAIARLSPVLDGRLDARKQLALLRGKSRIGDVVAPLDEKWDVDS